MAAASCCRSPPFSRSAPSSFPLDSGVISLLSQLLDAGIPARLILSRNNPRRLSSSAAFKLGEVRA